jgi:hypothetical protein
MKIGDAAPMQEEVNKQHHGVFITTSNEVFLYQFKAYPGFWSEPIVAPEKVEHVDIACEDVSQVQMQIDDQDASVLNVRCAPATRFRFRATTNKPIVVAVRFLRRDYLPQEKSTFSMPVYPPAKVVSLTAERQAKLDAITALLKQGEEFDGVRFGNDPVHAHLAYDNDSGLITGWILFPSSGNKKAVDGRIIDDQTTSPALQLVETKPLAQSPGGIAVGMVYWMFVTPDGKGFKGVFIFHDRPRQAANSASISLAPAAFPKASK